ncbi:hypothetical protein [Acidithiobacillus ferrianus]|uniref:Y-family DNA polymerase n=1 Tax=Acidithiobacillus ferrianus TaxID=2678518 RepID=UPI003C6F31C7
MSLDDAFLDVPAATADGILAVEIAREILDRIHRETRLTASAGVSYNKLLAKRLRLAQSPWAFRYPARTWSRLLGAAARWQTAWCGPGHCKNYPLWASTPSRISGRWRRRG